jgi:hypothetical protein
MKTMPFPASKPVKFTEGNQANEGGVYDHGIHLLYAVKFRFICGETENLAF